MLPKTQIIIYGTRQRKLLHRCDTRNTFFTHSRGDLALPSLLPFIRRRKNVNHWRLYQSLCLQSSHTVYICICIFDRYNQVCKPRLSLDGFTHGSKPNKQQQNFYHPNFRKWDNTFSMYSNMTCQVPYSARSINTSTDAIDRRTGATFFTVSHASSSPSFSCCEYILLCHTFDIERNLVTWENTQHRQLAVRFHLSDISLGTIIYGSLS